MRYGIEPPDRVGPHLCPICRRTGHDLRTGQFGGNRRLLRHNSTPCDGRGALMRLGAGFLALMLQKNSVINMSNDVGDVKVFGFCFFGSGTHISRPRIRSAGLERVTILLR